MAEVKIKMTGALVSQTGDITVENISTEETLEKVLKAAENINNTLKTNTTSVNTAQVNSRFNKLSETTSSLNKSFTSLNNSISDISKKLGNIDVSRLTDSVDDIRKNLDQTADDIGGFGGNLFDIAGSARGATEALNLFEASSEEMSAGASEAGAAVAGMSKKAAGALVAFQLLTNIVGGVVRILGGLFASAVKLISQFVMGENKLSAYTETVAEALSSIPFLGGILGSLVGIVAASIKVMEGYRDVQAQLAESGAAFGQDLMYMRKMAEKTGLGMEGFAGVISKNTEIFAKFGTVTQGAVLFAKTTAILRDRMRDMGYSIEDINEGLAQVMSLNTAGAAVRNQSDQALADTAQRLMTEMDAMAKLTGQSRRSQAEAIKKQQMTAAYQMALAKMDGASREMVNQEMMQMQAVMGDIGAEMVKLRVLGLQPFTNEQIMATTTMGRAVSILNNTTDLALKGKLNQEKLDEKTADILEAAGDDALRVKDVLRVAAAGLGGSAADISKNFDELYTRMGQFVDNTGKLDRKRFIESLKTIREEQKKRDLAAQSLNKFENSMMKLRTVLIDKVLTPLYNIFAPMLMEFADNFEKRLPDFYGKLDYLGKQIVEVIKNIAEWSITLSDTTWWEATWDQIKFGFEELLIDMRVKFWKIFGGLDQEQARRMRKDLEERREGARAQKEIKQAQSRAAVRGGPVDITEEQIKKAFDYQFRTLKDYEKYSGQVEELKKLQKESENIVLVPSVGQAPAQLKTKEKQAEDTKKYQESLAKLAKELEITEDEVKKLLKNNAEVLDKVLNASALKKLRAQMGVEADKDVYQKYRESVRKPSTNKFLQGFRDAGTDTLGDKIPVNIKNLKDLQIPIADTGRVHKEGAEISKKLMDLLPKIPNALKDPDVIKSGFKYQSYTVTGLNDEFHENDDKSMHPKGQAVDFVLNPAPTPEQGAKIKEALKKIGFDYVLNEYNPKEKSPRSSGDHIHAQISRAKGTLGATGKLFENFGTGTQITAHNLESIMTPNQLRDIITVSQKKLTNEVIDEIRRNDKESITDSQNKIVNDIAMVGKQITLNNETQNRMVNLLSQIREILGDSYRYHREIANNI